MACRPAFSSLPRAQRVLQAATFGNCCSKTTHAGATGPVWCFAGVVSLPWPKNLTQGHTEPSFFFAPKTSLPLPLKGEGLAIVFLGFAEFALLVYNRLTRLQQGPFGASLVSFYYSAFKTAHRATWG